MTTVAPPICRGCVHLHGDLTNPRCDAFPEEIPTPILLSQADHRDAYPGDHGVRFEPKAKADAEYADMLLGERVG